MLSDGCFHSSAAPVDRQADGPVAGWFGERRNPVSEEPVSRKASVQSVPAVLAQAREFDRGHHGADPSITCKTMQHALQRRVVQFAGRTAFCANGEHGKTVITTLPVGESA